MTDTLVVAQRCEQRSNQEHVAVLADVGAGDVAEINCDTTVDSDGAPSMHREGTDQVLTERFIPEPLSQLPLMAMFTKLAFGVRYDPSAE